MISTELLASYWEQGYLLLPRLFDQEKLGCYESRFLELVSGQREAPDRMIVMQDVMVAKGAVVPATPIHGINKILSFEDDPVLFQYSLSANLLEVVKRLIGDEVMTISTNVFNKPPAVDGRHPMHQDLRYFALRPADKIVGSWTALSACTREKGCLAVIPGSHRGDLLRHDTPDWDYVNYGFFSVENVDLDGRVHLKMEPGDTLLMHPLLVHGSGQNRSSEFRRSISTHYASVDCDRRPGPRKREPVTRRIP